MKLTSLILNNYKSFKEENFINFYGSRFALIGKNNSGKSNVINALNLLFGSKDPRYLNLDETYYYDIEEELFIKATLIVDSLDEIWDLPVAKKHKTAFARHFDKDRLSAIIELTINQKLDNSIESKFVIHFGSLQVYQKISDLRNSLAKNIIAPPIRSTKTELSASQWTTYGILMKNILENSPRYNELKTHLQNINSLIEDILNIEKENILKSSKLITFIEDLKFQLTKENKPSELLRNLEIFVKEDGKYFHIDDTGTGTQSTIIIAILEIALKYKTTKSKILCIEEPELYIHPQGIRFLSQLLDKIIRETDCQIIVSTHSPILISGLDPRSIIRIEKDFAGSRTFQLPYDFVDENNKIKRTLNSENAEMFFSTKVILVEGETEKIMFPELSKNIELETGKELNYYKNNYSVCSVGGKENIWTYMKILNNFNIQVRAIVDDDFLDMKKSYSKICDYYSINKDLPKDELRQKFKEIGIYAIEQGETEDLIPNNDLIYLTGKSLDEISEIKGRYSKTSKAFEKELFFKSKPEIAYEIVEYYLRIGQSPFDDIIKWAVE